MPCSHCDGQVCDEAIDGLSAAMRNHCAPFSDVGYLVAVGMAVTCHPQHRSVRAELPHTAPALGFDAEAGYGIRMHS